MFTHEESRETQAGAEGGPVKDPLDINVLRPVGLVIAVLLIIIKIKMFCHTEQA